MNWKEFMDVVRGYNKTHQITAESTQAEKLKEKIMSCGSRSKHEIIELHKEVEEFLKSDASEEDKNMVRGYTESLAIILDAIKKGLL